MENLNISGKSISELIKEAEAKDMQIVIIGAGASAGKHAALVARLQDNDKVMIVSLGDLTELEQQKVNLAMDRIP